MDPQSKAETKYKAKNLIDRMSDQMDIGKAKFSGDDASKLDVAVLKATLNDEVVPKEKHVVTLKIACSGSSQRNTVSYVIHSLEQRLEAHKGKWLVTLKTLIVFHRLMREVDPSFQEELVRYGERTSTRRMLRLDTFADHTTKETWDFSAWVRVYSVYLDERLDLFRVMKFDPEQAEGTESKLKSCSTPELLERMPLAHKLMSRLIACVPEGGATSNVVTVQACGLVLKEVKAVYRLVCEAVMNLADKFFEMDRTDAAHGLELYKENVALNDRLNSFFTSINNIGTMKGSVQFPTLQSLPADFLTTMEEYVRDAPRVLDQADSHQSTGSNKPVAQVRTSTIAKQGGLTSGAIAGQPGSTSLTLTLPPGTLHVGGPIPEQPPSSASAPEPSQAAPLLDLLGDDLGAVALGGASSLPHQEQGAGGQGGAQPLAMASPSGEFFGGAWMQSGAAAAAAAPTAPVPGPQQQWMQSGAAPPALPAQGQQQQQQQPWNQPGPPHAPQQQQQQQGLSPYAAPQAAQPYPSSAFPPPNPGAPPPHAPQPFPYTQYAPSASGRLQPGYGAAPQYPGAPYQGPSHPQPSPQQAPPPAGYGYPAAPAQALPYAPPAPANPFNAFPASSATPPPGSNPFTPALSPSPPAPSSGPPGWDPHHDPLSNLSIDILGKPSGYQPPQPTLKQLKGSPNGVQ